MPRVQPAISNFSPEYQRYSRDDIPQELPAIPIRPPSNFRVGRVGRASIKLKYSYLE
jgi:hypothetical protein